MKRNFYIFCLTMGILLSGINFSYAGENIISETESNDAIIIDETAAQPELIYTDDMRSEKEIKKQKKEEEKLNKEKIKQQNDELKAQAKEEKKLEEEKLKQEREALKESEQQAKEDSAKNIETENTKNVSEDEPDNKEEIIQEEKDEISIDKKPDKETEKNTEIKEENEIEVKDLKEEQIQDNESEREEASGIIKEHPAEIKTDETKTMEEQPVKSEDIQNKENEPYTNLSPSLYRKNLTFEDIDKNAVSINEFLQFTNKQNERFSLFYYKTTSKLNAITKQIKTKEQEIKMIKNSKIAVKEQLAKINKIENEITNLYKNRDDYYNKSLIKFNTMLTKKQSVKWEILQEMGYRFLPELD